MKILIVSDSHGRSHYLEKAILQVYPMDNIIHLGDIEGEEDYLREIAPCPVYMVAGNNDFFSREPREEIIQLGKYRILLTHGHHHNVYSGTDGLREAARNNDADIVMYGHTHIPKIENKDNVWIVNPGSISLPRQEGRKPSYLVMEIDSSQEVHFSLNYFER